MKNSIILILCLILSFANSCDKNEELESIVTFTVYPTTIIRPTLWEREVEHMVIKDSSNDSIIYLTLDRIEGFKYEKGFEYELKVKKIKVLNPPQDSSIYTYSLIEVLSKK